MKQIFACFIAILCAVSFVACDDQQSQNPAVSVLELSSQLISVKPGASHTLTLTVTPSSTESVVWSSSDEKVDTVLFGKRSAINEGTAVITATVGTESISCIVNVELTEYEPVWSEEFEGTELDLSTWYSETGGNVWGNQEKQYYTGRT